MQHQFPGSFLPFGFQQVVGSAEPYFRLVESSSGRLDNIETIKQWRARFGKRSVRKTLMKMRLVPRYLTSREFRLAFTSGVSANSVWASGSGSTTSGSCSLADEELLDREWLLEAAPTARAPRGRSR
jgi:hypothetical protein